MPHVSAEYVLMTWTAVLHALNAEAVKICLKQPAIPEGGIGHIHISAADANISMTMKSEILTVEFFREQYFIICLMIGLALIAAQLNIYSGHINIKD
jgi:urea transporter